MDAEAQERLVAELDAQAPELLNIIRHMRDERRAAGHDTTWLDEFLATVAPIAAQLGDAETMRAIGAVIDRHGSGPYPDEELALFADHEPDTVRRVLAELATTGLVERTDRGTPGYDEHPSA